MKIRISNYKIARFVFNFMRFFKRHNYYFGKMEAKDDDYKESWGNKKIRDYYYLIWFFKTGQGTRNIKDLNRILKKDE